MTFSGDPCVMTSHHYTSDSISATTALPFALLYTGPIPQPLTEGHFTSAQVLNLRKTPFSQCPGLFMEPPKNNDSIPTLRNCGALNPQSKTNIQLV